MRTFVCLYYPGSGSSWLMLMLGSVPGVWVPGYEPIESWHWDADDLTKKSWLASLLDPPSENDTSAFDTWLASVRTSPQASDPLRPGFTTLGLKMTWQAIPDHNWLANLIRSSGTRIVFLERRNRLKHALSLYRSYEEQKNQFRFQGILPPSDVDVEVFDKWLVTARDWHDRSEAFRKLCLETVGADYVLNVGYEEFASDEGKLDVIRTVCGFLDLDPSRPLDAAQVAALGGEPFGPEGYYRKATSDRLADAVRNIDELYDLYRGTEIEGDFADE